MKVSLSGVHATLLGLLVTTGSVSADGTSFVAVGRVQLEMLPSAATASHPSPRTDDHFEILSGDILVNGEAVASANDFSLRTIGETGAAGNGGPCQTASTEGGVDAGGKSNHSSISLDSTKVRCDFYPKPNQDKVTLLRDSGDILLCLGTGGNIENAAAHFELRDLEISNHQSSLRGQVNKKDSFLTWDLDGYFEASTDKGDESVRLFRNVTGGTSSSFVEEASLLVNLKLYEGSCTCPEGSKVEVLHAQERALCRCDEGMVNSRDGSVYVSKDDRCIVSVNSEEVMSEEDTLVELIERLDTELDALLDETTAVSTDRQLLWDGVEKEFCWAPTKFRGFGRLPKGCADSHDRIGLFCYEKCPSGYSRVGFNCHQDCPDHLDEYWNVCKSKDRTVPNCHNLGLGDQPLFAASCYRKVKTGKPEFGACQDGFVKEAGLCWYPCPPGYVGVGSQCWGQAPLGDDGSKWVSCGLGFAVDSATCGNVIFNQVFSIFEAILETVLLVVSGGASSGASASKQAAEKAAETGLDVADASLDLAKTAGKIAEPAQESAMKVGADVVKAYNKMRDKVKAYGDSHPKLKKAVQYLKKLEKKKDNFEEKYFIDKIEDTYGAADDSMALFDSVTSIDDEVTVADIVRFSAAAIGLCDPHGIVAAYAGIVEAYAYPPCDLYFKDQFEVTVTDTYDFKVTVSCTNAVDRDSIFLTLGDSQQFLTFIPLNTTHCDTNPILTASYSHTRKPLDCPVENFQLGVDGVDSFQVSKIEVTKTTEGPTSTDVTSQVFVLDGGASWCLEPDAPLQRELQSKSSAEPSGYGIDRKLAEAPRPRPIKNHGDTPPTDRLPLQFCEGDCDRDSDCAPGLKCDHLRGKLEAVPGCLGGLEFDWYTDFCIFDETGPGYHSPRPIKNHGDTPNSDKLPLQLCEGDCDYDSDCAEGLKCFQRQTGYTETPGCIGGETFSHVTDFCILDTEGSGYKSNIPTATYIGCYVDSSSNRVFSPDTFFSHDEPGFYWSRETCFAHCVSNEFKYAGITDGSRTFCMCGNDPPSTQKASDSDCPACIVEGEGNCGEAWRVAVYQFADETSPLSNQNGDGSCDSIQFFRFGDPIIDPNNRCENGQIEWALEDPYDIYGGNGETCDAWNICHWGMKCVLGECTDGGVGSFCLGNGHCHQKRCEATGVGIEGQCELPLENGSDCNENTDCLSTECFGGKCVPLAKNNEACGPDLHCEAELACLFGKQTCTDGKEGSECTVGSDCNGELVCYYGKCSRKAENGEECGPDLCIPSSTGEMSCTRSCSGSLKCLAFSVCTDGLEGSACTIHSDCIDGYACKGGKCELGKELGATCFWNRECQSGRCDGGSCLEALADGSSCNEASDCLSDACHLGKCTKRPGVGGSCAITLPCAEIEEGSNDCLVYEVHRCTDHKPGSPCYAFWDCWESEGATGCSNNICNRPKLLNETCSISAPCSDEFKCIGITQKCSDGALYSPCYLPGDCDSGLCHEMVCKPKRKNGEACGPAFQCEDGLGCLALKQVCTDRQIGSACNNADNCDSNSCKDGKCIEGADNGEFCDTLGLGVGCKPGLDCISGISLSPQCTDRQLGSPCVAYRNCDSGSCYQQQCVPLGQDGDACGGSRRCVDGTECLIIPVLKCSAGDRGSPCIVNGDCDSGLDYCSGGVCVARPTSGQQCGVGVPCANSKCLTSGYCSNGARNSPCVISSDCSSSYDACRASSPTKKCLARPTSGGSCGPDVHCMNSVCLTNYKCTDGSRGSPCVIGSDCNSSADYCGSGTCKARPTNGGSCSVTKPCYNSKCLTSGYCTNGALNSRCVIGSDCTSSRHYCSSGYCREKPTNGGSCSVSKPCYNSKCLTSGYCTNGALNSRCVIGSDCTSSRHYCSSGYCREKPTNGDTCSVTKPCYNSNCLVTGYCTDGQRNSRCYIKADCKNSNDACLSGRCQCKSNGSYCGLDCGTCCAGYGKHGYCKCIPGGKLCVGGACNDCCNGSYCASYFLGGCTSRKCS